MDSSDVGIPRPGTSAEEIMIRPLHAYRLPDGFRDLCGSFDLDGDDSGGYPEAAGCARAMQHALRSAGHASAILVQLWRYRAHGERVAWQMEYNGQDDLGQPSSVEAMRTWMDAGAPVAFIARLTGNECERVKAVLRPVVRLEAVGKPRIVARIGGVRL